MKGTDKIQKLLMLKDVLGENRPQNATLAKKPIYIDKQWLLDKIKFEAYFEQEEVTDNLKKHSTNVVKAKMDEHNPTQVYYKKNLSHYTTLRYKKSRWCFLYIKKDKRDPFWV